jgi:hypothetical protein
MDRSAESNAFPSVTTEFLSEVREAREAIQA